MSFRNYSADTTIPAFPANDRPSTSDFFDSTCRGAELASVFISLRASVVESLRVIAKPQSWVSQVLDNTITLHLSLTMPSHSSQEEGTAENVPGGLSD